MVTLPTQNLFQKVGHKVELFWRDDVRPSGLFQSLAIFATSLLGATPALIVS